MVLQAPSLQELENSHGCKSRAWMLPPCGDCSSAGTRGLVNLPAVACRSPPRTSAKVSAAGSKWPLEEQQSAQRTPNLALLTVIRGILCTRKAEAPPAEQTLAVPGSWRKSLEAREDHGGYGQTSAAPRANSITAQELR